MTVADDAALEERALTRGMGYVVGAGEAWSCLVRAQSHKLLHSKTSATRGSAASRTLTAATRRRALYLSLGPFRVRAEASASMLSSRVAIRRVADKPVAEVTEAIEVVPIGARPSSSASASTPEAPLMTRACRSACGGVELALVDNLSR